MVIILYIWLNIVKSELFGIEATRKNCNVDSTNITNSTARSNFKHNKYEEKLSFSYKIYLIKE
ncbi:MAG: hypothetical protein RLZZ210_62 [Pseudomonadota bacterium]|jgi:hypothetical protein